MKLAGYAAGLHHQGSFGTARLFGYNPASPSSVILCGTEQNVAQV
jgi:hypothetical protein